ncbi:ferrous iron transport protein B [Sulfobacillus thermotolerans]|uniref:Ferrous iron transport protein B n=1 Tax=Sulfobacillus thermotolerans TaxID=338644 RepID=A0ABM6RS16_9FIRM|nr:ferrous iron transport protein B [Sulfobacillus thermotolerans]
MPGRKIVLVGNPNVGKSVVFQKLTGRYVEVSNFPGSTVQMFESVVGDDLVVDTPGVYGLSRWTEEERITVEALKNADLVVNVVDGTHLSRDLFLTLQLLDAGFCVIVAVNMMDQVAAQGGFVDTARLEEELKVPVVGVAAVQGRNIAVLKSLLDTRLEPPVIDPQWAVPETWHLSSLEAVLWYEEDKELRRQVGTGPEPGERERRYIERRERADRIAAAVYRPGRGAPALEQWLDRVLLSPWGGLASAGVLSILVYYFVGTVVAGTVVNFLQGVTMQWVVPFMGHLIGSVVPRTSLPYRLLMGQYGIVSAGLLYIVALLLPLVTGFYLLLALLEDSGYLPRLATVLDRWFLRLGLNGRAVIPLVLGFGCVTMATLTTRVLETQRERTIATILLAWTIPCSAQMGVIIGLLSGIGWPYALSYVLIITGLFVAVGTVLDRSLPGRPTPLLLDLPRLSVPQLSNVVWKTQTKVLEFLREAGPLFLWGSALVELGDIFGFLPWLDRTLAPVMRYWLGLPAQAVQPFVLGFIRRDFGAAGFYQLGLTPHQILTGAVTLTLFVPCMASTLVILKERGWMQGAAIWGGSIALALVVGGLVARFGPI